MYALETHKECLISERCFSGGLMDLPSHVWAWRRSPRDGIEKAQFDDLVNLLVGFKPTDVRDSWTFSLSSLNTYTVSSMRCAIDSSTLVSTIDKVKWNKTLPIKINIHSWRLRKDRLPTRSNLDARGIDIDSLRCPLRGKYGDVKPHVGIVVIRGGDDGYCLVMHICYSMLLFAKMEIHES
ncbi:reverse transcriptase zinc-binding domain-containing protein [Artemisia annua]|uniref:Reverse transcriptase zinc-binding domain-containing protein n=1 Tax=Artemisia annua TaxID=35608 RepID=A0A2U1KY00_ARTAN|nr:reverse transcriptase zinc-binding domain-containing protein [Artemisia annua]